MEWPDKRVYYCTHVKPCMSSEATHSLTHSLTPSHMSIDDKTTYDIEQMKEEKEGTSDVVT
jgi:hypothetical protein